MEIERRNKANRNKIWMHTINTKGATTTTTITNSLLLFLNRAFVTCLCYCFFFVSPVHSLCTGMNVLALKWLHSAVVRRLSLYFFFLIFVLLTQSSAVHKTLQCTEDAFLYDVIVCFFGVFFSVVRFVFYLRRLMLRFNIFFSVILFLLSKFV